MGIVLEYLIPPIAVFNIIVGILASVSNLLVFVVMFRKPDNLLACEILISTICFLSFMFGFLLQYTGFSYFLHQSFIIQMIKGDNISICFISLVLPNFLMTSCLGLVVLITLNRYAAIKLTFEYSTVFSRKRTYFSTIILLIVCGLNSIPEMLTCACSKFEHYIEFFHAYYIYQKAILVSACAFMLIFVYKTISGYFLEPFWSPLTGLVNTFCRDSGNEGHTPGTRLADRRLTVITMGTGMETGAISLDDDEPDAGNPETLPISPSTQPVHPPPPTTVSSSRGRRGRNATSRHTMTATLFLGAFLFIAVTLPSCLYETVCYVLPDHLLPASLSAEIHYLTACLYGSLFVLNPLMFTGNDRYVQRQTKRLFMSILRVVTFERLGVSRPSEV